jgi:hypothetical protein
MAGTRSGHDACRRGAAWASGLACAAILCLFSLAPRADAAWSPFVNVVTNKYVSQPKVAMDPAGNTVFMWRRDTEGEGFRFGALYTRSQSADGSLSPVQRLSPRVPEGEYHDLAVDSQGNAYFVWRTWDGPGFQIRARVRSADGTLGPVKTLKAGDYVEDPTVAAYGGGNAVFAWQYSPQDGPDMIQARSMSASGALAPLRTVARADFPDVNMGVDSQGNATFVWEDFAQEHLEAFTRVVAPDGHLGPIERISPLGGEAAFTPEVAVTPSGRAIFNWADYKSSDFTFTLVARARAADGSLQPIQRLTTFDGGQNLSFQPAVAPNGEAVFCWHADGAIRARTRAPGGALGPARTIGSTPYGAGQPGFDSQGNIVFAWGAPVGSKDRVFVRSEDAAGHLGPTQALSPAGRLARSPVLAVSPAGSAVAWLMGTRGWGIQAAFDR